MACTSQRLIGPSRMRRWGLCLGGWVLCLVTPLLAGEPRSPSITLWSTTGEHLSGPLLGIDQEQLGMRVGTQDRMVPVSSLWQISVAPGTTRPPRPRFWLHLTNGDRVGVSSVTLTEEVLEFHVPTDEQPVRTRKLGVEFIAGVQFLRPGTSWRTDESEWRLIASQREKSDLVVLRNGDRLTGEVTEIGTSSIELTGSQGKQPFEWPAVAGLLLNPDLAEVPPLAKQGWVVLLADDSWLTATEVETVAEGRLNLLGAQGLELSIPWSNIRWIWPWGRGAMPLSRLPLAEQKHAPWLGEILEVARDRNLRGLPLRHSAGIARPALNRESSPLPSVCPLGLGLSSGMTVRWDLNKNYRRWQCSFGLDATAGPEGYAVVRLIVDDRPPQTITLRSGEAMAKETMLDLTGANSLTIETDYGENADASDWINLYAPILVPADGNE